MRIAQHLHAGNLGDERDGASALPGIYYTSPRISGPFRDPVTISVARIVQSEQSSGNGNCLPNARARLLCSGLARARGGLNKALMTSLPPCGAPVTNED